VRQDATAIAVHTWTTGLKGAVDRVWSVEDVRDAPVGRSIWYTSMVAEI
jgi:hypothetical protein